MNMGDTFVEKMVRKQNDGKDALLIVAILAGVVAVSAIGFVVGFFVLAYPMITVLITAGAIFGGYKLICMRLLEYEYSLTNGWVTVDKIIHKESRKRMTSFECSSCEDIGSYKENEERLKKRSFDARIFATAHADHRDSWFMIVHSKKTGKTLVVFDPDEDLQDAIKKFIPRQLKFEKFSRG